MCPECHRRSIGKMQEVQLSGKGEVYSFSVVHDAPARFLNRGKLNRWGVHGTRFGGRPLLATFSTGRIALSPAAASCSSHSFNGTASTVIPSNS